METSSGDPSQTRLETMDDAKLPRSLDDSQVIEEIRERLKLRMADALGRSCSAGDATGCHLLDDWTSWNEVLHPVGFELYECEPGRLTLKSLNTHMEDVTARESLSSLHGWNPEEAPGICLSTAQSLPRRARCQTVALETLSAEEHCQ